MDAIQKSNSGKVIVSKFTMPSDFCVPFDYSSTHFISKTKPRPYLSEMVQVTFQRGSLDLKYKNSFDEKTFIEMRFLKAKYVTQGKLPVPPTKTTLRGINRAKQEEIVRKLVPLMPENRRNFWTNLPVGDV